MDHEVVKYTAVIKYIPGIKHQVHWSHKVRQSLNTLVIKYTPATSHQANRNHEEHTSQQVHASQVYAKNEANCSHQAIAHMKYTAVQHLTWQPQT
jgi:hypothetical protein